MRDLLLTFGILAAALLAAVPASAQVRPGGRTWSGLFGGSALDARNSQGLNLTGSLGGGYDKDNQPNPSGSGAGTSTSQLRTGSYGIAAASLSYGVKEGPITGSLSGGGRARYYPSVSSPIVGTFSVGGDLAVPIGTHVTVDTSDSAGMFVRGADFYGIYSDVNGSGIGGADESLGAITSAGRYTSVRTNVGVRGSVSTRVSLYARYDYYMNNLFAGTAASGTGRYNARAVTGGISYAMLKTVSLRAGYSRTEATTSAAVAGQAGYTMRGFDGGIDFNKALSLTRRSTLTFATGLSAIADQHGSVRYLFVGTANVNYEMGRSWTLHGSIGRNVDFFAAFAQPMLLDRGTLSAAGLINRKLQVSISASVIRSEALAPVVVSGYTAAHSGVSTKYALNRDFAIAADYSIYRYEFGDRSLLPPGVLSQINRQSVRVSLDMWAPLLTQSRRR